MNLSEYQEECSKLALPSAKGLQYLIPGLAGEAGEVAGVFAKWVRDDTEWGTVKQAMKKELGDVLWFVAMTAEYFGYDLEYIAEQNIEKLRDRQQRGVLGGSGNER